MSKFHALSLGLLKASMFDSVVSTGRTLLENANLLGQAEDIFYYFTHFPIRNWFKLYNKMDIRHEENIPRKGGMIVVANHRSHLDPIFISSATFRKIHWMSKMENFEQPIMKSVFSMWSAFPVERGKGDTRALRTAIDHLKNDRCIGVFPEGTRSIDGTMGHFHNGAAKLAVMTGATLMPCGVTGTYQVLKKGKTVPKPVKVIVNWGTPVPTHEVKGQHENWDLVKSYTTRIEKQIHDLVGENAK
ncbi:hypothetical protein GF325_11790 [Candidatus Bathyarchaeota archaeon]|nr:hypothetical protein [Candidatus Bathyarchaeota archaeon]